MVISQFKIIEENPFFNGVVLQMIIIWKVKSYIYYIFAFQEVESTHHAVEEDRKMFIQVLTVDTTKKTLYGKIP